MGSGITPQNPLLILKAPKLTLNPKVSMGSPQHKQDAAAREIPPEQAVIWVVDNGRNNGTSSIIRKETATGLCRSPHSGALKTLQIKPSGSLLATILHLC